MFAGATHNPPSTSSLRADVGRSTSRDDESLARTSDGAVPAAAQSSSGVSLFPTDLFVVVSVDAVDPCVPREGRALVAPPPPQPFRLLPREQSRLSAFREPISFCSSSQASTAEACPPPAVAEEPPPPAARGIGGIGGGDKLLDALALPCRVVWLLPPP